MTIHTGLDMCPYWLEIAYAHLEKTEEIHLKLIAANSGDDPNLIGELLQEEFMSGMQTIMGACIAIDAYYASIKKFANIPNKLSQVWKKKGTARYSQIAETLKRVFPIQQEMFLQIRQILKELFFLRDRAVHPHSGTDIPVPYPEIHRISDWRYSAFRYANAKIAVQHALSIIYYTAKKITIQDTEKDKQDLKKICEKVTEELAPTLNKWTERYGELFDKK